MADGLSFMADAARRDGLKQSTINHQPYTISHQPSAMTRLIDRRVVFFGGKGGVGKTTCSSAFALEASGRGRRVLLVSTDPAHSTSDIFERRIGNSATELLPALSAIEIDAEQESARYIAQVKRDI